LSSAVAVADRLRDRIASGELADGAALPPLDDLVIELAASKPTVRLGLQILEVEGLLRVRRGRLGGAVVCHPRPTDVAHLLLRAGAQDVAEALRQIEPVCAGMCAGRPDRAEKVVPALRKVHDAGRRGLDDAGEWPAHARRFHEELVQLCGNETMTMLIGGLESVCSERAAAWAAEGEGDPEFPVRDHHYRQRGWDDHALILTFIERGDVEAASREARRHLQWVPVYP